MRYLWFILVVPLLAMTQINNVYDEEQAVYTDFKNIYDNAQDESFKIVRTTPNASELKEGQFVIYQASGNSVDVNLMLRAGNTVYASPFFPIIKAR